MSPRTRRRVFVTVLVVALSAPVDLLFLSSLFAQTPGQWATTLTPEALNSVADHVQNFPFLTRRSIMGALPAAGRAQAWRNFIGRYIQAHPELTGSAVDVLHTAQSLLTPDLFEDPSPAQRASVKAVGEQVETLLGKEAAAYLLVRMGPADGPATLAALPLSMRFQAFVQDHLTVAADQRDCDCAMSYGCYVAGGSATCAGGTSCRVDATWPSCGYFWMENCDGLCNVQPT